MNAAGAPTGSARQSAIVPGPLLNPPRHLAADPGGCVRPAESLRVAGQLGELLRP